MGEAAIAVVASAFRCSGDFFTLLPKIAAAGIFAYVYRHSDDSTAAPCALTGGLPQLSSSVVLAPNKGRESRVYLYHLSLHPRRHLFTFFTQEGEFYHIQPFVLSLGFRRRVRDVKFLGAAVTLCQGHGGRGDGGGSCLRNFCWLERDISTLLPPIQAVTGWRCPAEDFVCGLRGSFGVHRDAIPPHLAPRLLNVSMMTPSGLSPKGCPQYTTTNAWTTTRAAYGHAVERLWPEFFRAGENAICATSFPPTLWLTNPPPHTRYPSLVCRWDSSTSLVPKDVRTLSKAAVAEVVAMPSACVPDGFAVLSIATDYHVPLRRLGMSLAPACLVSRLVSLCFGFDDGLGKCVTISRATSKADFLKGAYHALVWAKWKLISAALVVARAVLFVDADVLVFGDVFSAIDAPALLRKRDVFFQIESGCKNCYSFVDPAHRGVRTRFIATCPLDCPVNGGVILVKNGTGRRVVQRVLQREPRAFDKRTQLDQTIVDSLIRSLPPLPRTERERRNHFTHDRLPVSFGGHCWLDVKRARSRVDVCGLSTYHMQCSTTMVKKLAYMQWLADAFKRRCRSRGEPK